MAGALERPHRRAWQARHGPTDRGDCSAEYPPAYPFGGVSSLSGYILGRNNQRAMREDTTTEIRCGQCHKLLARGWARDAHIIHKCPRCGAYNTLRATRPHSEPHDGQSRSNIC